MTPSLLELCDHARRSCTVNGLRPIEWRWGNDVACLYAESVHEQILNGDIDASDGIQMPRFFQTLPVRPMRALGVACIGKKPYVSLLKKE